jgi:hypothetical protein
VYAYVPVLGSCVPISLGLVKVALYEGLAVLRPLRGCRFGCLDVFVLLYYLYCLLVQPGMRLCGCVPCCCSMLCCCLLPLDVAVSVLCTLYSVLCTAHSVCWMSLTCVHPLDVAVMHPLNAVCTPWMLLVMMHPVDVACRRRCPTLMSLSLSLVYPLDLVVLGICVCPLCGSGVLVVASPTVGCRMCPRFMGSVLIPPVRDYAS